MKTLFSLLIVVLALTACSGVNQPISFGGNDQPEPTEQFAPVQNNAPSTGDPIPAYAVPMIRGETRIPNWGYGPWGVPEVEYPNVFPGGTLLKGSGEAKTDFDGRNWVSSGCWSWTLPSSYKAVFVTVQGDTPAEVSVSGNTITACTSGEITARAQNSVNNGTPRPEAGSSGFSLVMFIK